ncbi:MAG: ferrous iron transport protein B [Holophaga sp.]|nr:ferrous iron transport protein B [Holophaga sp.]
MEKQTYTIGLAGNPNCGKTTMFNALTGGHQRVGNWPGVTVEKKIGKVTAGDIEIDVVDLPGTYSLTSYADDERAARNFLIDDKPAVVIDVLNADSLERNLYLAIQMMELGVPLVLALNMMDEVRKNGKEINVGLLAQLMDSPTVETVARSGIGKRELINEAIRVAQAKNGKAEPLRISYGPDLDPVLDEMELNISKARLLSDKGPARWVGIKYLEGDASIRRQGRERNESVSRVLEAMVENVSRHLKATLGATPDAIIADYRYGFLAGIAKQVVSYTRTNASRIALSDRMDRVLTQQVLGPLIMAATIYLIYVLTFTVGKIPMDWMQTGFTWLGKTVEAAMPEGMLRSLLVSGIIAGVGGVLGFVPLIMIMFFLLSALEDSGYVARMAYMVDRIFRIFGLHGVSVLPLIVSGGIAGGCAVPGVMATRTLRNPKEKLATVLAAPLMACGAKVPVFLMLAAAFFPGEEAKVMSIVTLCGWIAALFVAKLLRSTLIKGESTPFVMELPPYRMPTLRGLCIHTWERSWQYVRKAGTVILCISILVWAAMTFPALSEDQAKPFEDRIAAIQVQAGNARANLEETEATPAEKAEKLGDFNANAGKAQAEAKTTGDAVEVTDPTAEALKTVEAEKSEASLRNSLAGRAGAVLESVMSPAGFNWRVNIALLGGFAAKEVIVATLATAYSLGEIDTKAAAPLSETLAQDKSFPKAAAVALIAFVLLYAPCMVTVVTMAKEVGWRWATFAVGFNTVLAYMVAVVIFQAARFMG